MQPPSIRPIIRNAIVRMVMIAYFPPPPLTPALPNSLDSNNQIALQFPADKVLVPHSRRRVLQECRTILRFLWITGSFVPKPISCDQDTRHPLSKGLPWPVSGAS